MTGRAGRWGFKFEIEAIPMAAVAQVLSKADAGQLELALAPRRQSTGKAKAGLSVASKKRRKAWRNSPKHFESKIEPEAAPSRRRALSLVFIWAMAWR